MHLQDFCLRRVSDRFPILLRAPGFAVDLTNQYNGCIAPMNCSIKLSTWDWDVLHLRIRLCGSRKLLWCGRVVCAEDLNRVISSETLGLDLWLVKTLHMQNFHKNCKCVISFSVIHWNLKGPGSWNSLPGKTRKCLSYTDNGISV